MRGAYLPGEARVEVREVSRPKPGPGQVLVEVRASGICGSDLRAIYHEHTGQGAERYRDVVAGHEPCGVVVELGPGCRGVAVGDRVVVYHISGCGRCGECRRGQMISCSSPDRGAYGWQRDGGHADLLLAEERDLLPLDDRLTFLDGACIACGFGTAYEAVLRADVSGWDRVLVTGLGPVGMGVAMLARAAGASRIVGVEGTAGRAELGRRLGLLDEVVEPTGATGSSIATMLGGGATVAIDCSGVTAARSLALESTANDARCVLVGEGGRLDVEASPIIIHRRLHVMGSWVTSTWRMLELIDQLAAKDLHPEQVVTDTFDLDHAADAYRRADAASGGKVAIVVD